eukprot:scaffold1499_cov255-Pinguiococcus_pyrenoidosus.AAC.6
MPTSSDPVGKGRCHRPKQLEGCLLNCLGLAAETGFEIREQRRTEDRNPALPLEVRTETLVVLERLDETRETAQRREGSNPQRDFGVADKVNANSYDNGQSRRHGRNERTVAINCPLRVKRVGRRWSQPARPVRLLLQEGGPPSPIFLRTTSEGVQAFHDGVQIPLRVDILRIVRIQRDDTLGNGTEVDQQRVVRLIDEGISSRTSAFEALRDVQPQLGHLLARGRILRRSQHLAEKTKVLDGRTDWRHREEIIVSANDDELRFLVRRGALPIQLRREVRKQELDERVHARRIQQPLRICVDMLRHRLGHATEDRQLQLRQLPHLAAQAAAQPPRQVLEKQREVLADRTELLHDQELRRRRHARDEGGNQRARLDQAIRRVGGVSHDHAETHQGGRLAHVRDSLRQRHNRPLQRPQEVGNIRREVEIVAELLDEPTEPRDGHHPQVRRSVLADGRTGLGLTFVAFARADGDTFLYGTPSCHADQYSKDDGKKAGNLVTELADDVFEQMKEASNLRNLFWRNDVVTELLVRVNFADLSLQQRGWQERPQDQPNEELELFGAQLRHPG